MITDLDGANCVGKHDLFDSTHPADHREARELCTACPARLTCALLLQKVTTDTAGTRHAGGGPVGTWAGSLIGKSGKRREIEQEHGTDRGYHQHRYRREAACPECKAAHLAVYHARKSAA